MEPLIIKKYPNKILRETCASVGQIVEVKARGFLARVLQHEIDHLKGRLIIDYMSALER